MLNDTRVSDAGVYRCVVNNPPEAPDPGIGELELSVVGTWAPPGQLKVSAALPPQEGAGDDTPPPSVLCFSPALPARVSVGRRRQRGGERHAVLLGGGGDPRPRDPLD